MFQALGPRVEAIATRVAIATNKENRKEDLYLVVCKLGPKA